MSKRIIIGLLSSLVISMTLAGSAAATPTDGYAVWSWGRPRSAWRTTSSAVPYGHRNALGLRSTARIERLMRRGLLIDLAHMSDRAMTETIDLAEQLGYPVLNTHSGIRSDDRPQCGNYSVPDTDDGRRCSERAMRASLATRMAKLGGMIGFGPGDGGGSPQPIYDWFENHIGASITTQGRVALGTDLNGLAVQMSAPEIAIVYPFRVAEGLDFRPSSPGTPMLMPLMFGAKIYRFEIDGLAHVGMLPEFLEAARIHASSLQGSLLPLYRSANDFIDLWERAIEASANM